MVPAQLSIDSNVPYLLKTFYAIIQEQQEMQRIEKYNRV